MSDFRPHITSAYHSDKSWCGEHIGDWWMQGSKWRYTSADCALMAGLRLDRMPDVAKPCAACVAAIIETLLTLSPESMALTKKEGETLKKLVDKATKPDPKPAKQAPKKPAPKTTVKKAAATKPRQSQPKKSPKK